MDGLDIRRNPRATLAERVGLAFQNRIGSCSPARFCRVALGAQPGLRGTALDERVAAALEPWASARKRFEPVRPGYSRRKLLALASVLAMRTPILALDEPTTGQDARGAARVRAVVAAAGERADGDRGEPRHAFRAECFRRVVVMRAGRVILDGTPERPLRGFVGELRAAYLEPPFAAVSGARWAWRDADRSFVRGRAGAEQRARR